MLYISSLCTILPEPLRSIAPHQLCHVRHVRFGLLMTSLMLPHCLLIPRACCDPIATCCAACDAAAANALPCDAQTRCELRIQLRTCSTLCANCTSTPLHSSHFPYALPQHHLPLQDPSLDPMRVLQRGRLVGSTLREGVLSRSRIGPRPGQYPGPDGSLALEDHRRLERGSTPEFSSPARRSASQP